MITYVRWCQAAASLPAETDDGDADESVSPVLAASEVRQDGQPVGVVEVTGVTGSCCYPGSDDQLITDYHVTMIGYGKKTSFTSLYYTEANLPNRYSALCWRPVTHVQTWASYSALYWRLSCTNTSPNPYPGLILDIAGFWSKIHVCSNMRSWVRSQPALAKDVTGNTCYAVYEYLILINCK